MVAWGFPSRTAPRGPRTVVLWPALQMLPVVLSPAALGEWTWLQSRWHWLPSLQPQCGPRLVYLYPGAEALRAQWGFCLFSDVFLCEMDGADPLGTTLVG